MLRQIYLLLQSVVSGNAITATFGGSRSRELSIASALAVTSSPTPSSEVDVSALETLGLQIINSGSGALSGFEIQVKSNSNADWISLFSQAGSYTAPPLGSPLKGTSGDLTTLAGGTDGWLLLEVGFYSKVRFVLTSAAGTTITILGNGKALTLLPA